MVLCVKVKKKDAEHIKRMLVSKEAFDDNYAPVSDKEYVYFPVLRKISSKPAISFVSKKLVRFVKAVREPLPSFDITGDIAIFEMPRELKGKKGSREAIKKIADSILCQHKSIHTVGVKTGPISGRYRLRKFKVVAGEKRTVTIHKENGCLFKTDVSEVYYSPRLSFERKRINTLIKPRETVFVPFAGVGPFAIVIAKFHPDVKVIANELNPTGFKYLKENIRLNKTFNVTAVPGDARKLLNQYRGMADRVLMPLPMSSDEFLDVAFGLCKPGGIVHFYWFTDSIETAENTIKKYSKKAGRTVKILSSRQVRPYSPNIIEVAVDFQVS